MGVPALASRRLLASVLAGIIKLIDRQGLSKGRGRFRRTIVACLAGSDPAAGT